MSQYTVGAAIKLTVTVTDKATGVAVDPGTFALRIKPPTGSGLSASTYAWDGAAWTNSESVIAVPAKVATGVFTLTITIPYANTAKGDWNVGWKSTANLSGLGEGAGFSTFIALVSPALD